MGLNGAGSFALLRSGTLSNQRARLPSTEVLTSFCRRIRTRRYNAPADRFSQRLQGRFTDHSPISHHRDLSQPETLSHALDYRYERFDIGCVARPHLAADRPALDLQGHADDHQVKIGPAIL